MIYNPRHGQKSRYYNQKIILKLLLILVGLIIFGFIFLTGLFAWYARDLPSPGKLSQIAGFSSIFYDQKGEILYEMYKDKNRIPVTIDQVPDTLKKATIAIEDKNFYQHRGISEIGILRAFFNIIFRGNIQGGSTITQQLIKNVLLDSQRTPARKIKEMILAYAVERRYSKDQILEMYLNEAPYGGSFWGIVSASQGYFGKDPKQLSLVESAILAGLPQRPSYYSPFVGEKDSWKGRTKDVLRRLREDGVIDRKQELKAVKELDLIKFSSPKFAIKAPHFVFYLKDKIERDFGPKIFDQGIKIYTTIDSEIQKKAEAIVAQEIKNLKNLNVTNAAVVVLDTKTGAILAMVGSYDFFDEKFGKFNAGLGLRQPGSAIKPITYAVAFENGYTPATVLMDLKTVFPNQGGKDYIPANYDGKFRGPIQLRFALGNSVNVPAVKLLAMVGIKKFLEQANLMGLTTLAPTSTNLNRFGLSITLGGGEVTLLDMTSAFSVFARAGIKKEVYGLNEIKTYQDKSIYKTKLDKGQSVLSKESAFLISHILSDNNARIDVFGPNSYLKIPGKTVAVKTGTTDDKRDNWAIGFTKSVTVGVWVGNNDNTPMNPQITSGATGASPIWYRIMIELMKRYPDGIMDKPDTIKALEIDAFLGGLPKAGFPTRSEYFRQGTEPKDISPFYKKLKISKATGKLANEIEIKTNNYEEKEFIAITENDPVSIDGRNRWQEAIDQWVQSQADERYRLPSETSITASEDVIVSIKNPPNEQTITNNNITYSVRIYSVYPLKTIKISLNGNEIKSLYEDRNEVEDTLYLADGVYELKVIAVNDKGRTGDSSIRFGVNRPWNEGLSPTSTP